MEPRNGTLVAAAPATEVPPVTKAEGTPAPTQSPDQAQATPAIERGPPSSEPPPVIREAKLIRRIDPAYPSAAKRDGVQGSVDLEVTVSPKGVVQDVSVVHANPPGVFEKSATAAVRKWKYDPRFVDGLPAEAHLKVHLEFGPG